MVIMGMDSISWVYPDDDKSLLSIMRSVMTELGVGGDGDGGGVWVRRFRMTSLDLMTNIVYYLPMRT